MSSSLVFLSQSLSTGRDTSHTEEGTTLTTSVYLNSFLTGPVDVIVLLYLLVLHMPIQPIEV